MVRPATSLAAIIAFLMFCSFAVAGPRLALMPAEIEGDIGDSAKLPQWQKRLENLESLVSGGLGSAGRYDIVDPHPADDLFARYAQRASVFDCLACALAVAERLDADRVLSLKVHRMSHLVMNLHAVLRDADTGHVRYARYLSFRGDTDEAWQHAADYLLRDMSAIPPGKL